MTKRATAVILVFLLLATLIACSKQPIMPIEETVGESVTEDTVTSISDDSKESDDSNTVSTETPINTSTTDTIKYEETTTAEKNKQSPSETISKQSNTETPSSPREPNSEKAENAKATVPSTEKPPVTTDSPKASESASPTEPKVEPTAPPQTEAPKETTSATEPEPKFDIDYWISFAKSYAKKVGLGLNPDATYCWDNPIAAGTKCKNTERDIKDCLDWYSINEDISEVWVWAEPTGENSYELYIGYA